LETVLKGIANQAAFPTTS